MVQDIIHSHLLLPISPKRFLCFPLAPRSLFLTIAAGKPLYTQVRSCSSWVQILQRFPISLKVKPKSSKGPIRPCLPCPLSAVNAQYYLSNLISLPFPIAAAPPATRASLLFPQHSKHAPAQDLSAWSSLGPESPLPRYPHRSAGNFSCEDFPVRPSLSTLFKTLCHPSTPSAPSHTPQHMSLHDFLHIWPSQAPHLQILPILQTLQDMTAKIIMVIVQVLLLSSDAEQLK